METLKKEEPIQLFTIIDEIGEYNYVLTKEDGNLYKKYFEELKKELTKEEIDYEIYAKLISELFVIDFYTLDNKVTNMDIGGTQFLNPSIVDNFILKATDTVYKYVKSNINNDRNQELPVVSEVSIDYIRETDNIYDVKVLVNYQKDLDYPKSVNLTINKENNKLYIISVK